MQTLDIGRRVSAWYRDHSCVSQPILVNFSGVVFPGFLFGLASSNSHLAWPIVAELGPRSFAALLMVAPGSSYLLCSIYLLASGLCLSLCNMWWWGHWILAPVWFSCWANGQKKALGVGEGREEVWEEKSSSWSWLSPSALDKLILAIAASSFTLFILCP